MLEKHFLNFPHLGDEEGVEREGATEAAASPGGWRLARPVVGDGRHPRVVHGHDPSAERVVQPLQSVDLKRGKKVFFMFWQVRNQFSYVEGGRDGPLPPEGGVHEVEENARVPHHRHPPFPLHCDELRKLKGRWLVKGEKNKL